jgi:hypothetical protein
MKVTQITHTSSSKNIKAQQSTVSFQSFSNSLTEEEKKSVSFFEWSDERLGQLAQLYYLDHIQSYPDRLDALKMTNIMLSHFMFEHHLTHLDISHTFAGTKDQVQQEVFSLHINLYNLNEPKPDIKPHTHAVMENETGQEKHYAKFEQFANDLSSFTAILGQLRQQVDCSHSDLQQQKRNEINLIHASVFIVHLAHDMSLMAARTCHQEISGLSNASLDENSAQAKMMEHTEVIFDALLDNVVYQLTWHEEPVQIQTGKPKFN